MESSCIFYKLKSNTDISVKETCYISCLLASNGHLNLQSRWKSYLIQQEVKVVDFNGIIAGITIYGYITFFLPSFDEVILTLKFLLTTVPTKIRYTATNDEGNQNKI